MYDVIKKIYTVRNTVFFINIRPNALKNHNVLKISVTNCSTLLKDLKRISIKVLLDTSNPKKSEKTSSNGGEC